MTLRSGRLPAASGRGLALLMVAALVACTPDTDTPPVAATTSAPATVAAAPTDIDIDPQLLRPLTMLGPCRVDPKAIDATPPDGAVFPEGAVITSQESTGPLTTLKGYIPMTPIQVQVFYQRQERFEVLQIENEIQESEALLADGNSRLFVKAQAVCELGSVFLAVVAPESASSQVPTPAGSPPSS